MKAIDNLNANMTGFGSAAKTFVLSGANAICSLTHAIGTFIANVSAEGQLRCLKGINKENALRDGLEVLKEAEVNSKHLYEVDAEKLIKSGVLPKYDNIETAKRINKKEFTTNNEAIKNVWASISTKSIEL